MTGDYRPICAHPHDIQWSIVHYDNPDETLLSTDLDRMQVPDEMTTKESEACARRALILEFSLGASQYATMFLREVMKQQTSVVGTDSNPSVPSIDE